MRYQLISREYLELMFERYDEVIRLPRAFKHKEELLIQITRLILLSNTTHKFRDFKFIIMMIENCLHEIDEILCHYNNNPLFDVFVGNTLMQMIAIKMSVNQACEAIDEDRNLYLEEFRLTLSMDEVKESLSKHLTRSPGDNCIDAAFNPTFIDGMLMFGCGSGAFAITAISIGNNMGALSSVLTSACAAGFVAGGYLIASFPIKRALDKLCSLVTGKESGWGSHISIAAKSEYLERLLRNVAKANSRYSRKLITDGAAENEILKLQLQTLTKTLISITPCSVLIERRPLPPLEQAAPPTVLPASSPAQLINHDWMRRLSASRWSDEDEFALNMDAGFAIEKSDDLSPSNMS